MAKSLCLIGLTFVLVLLYCSLQVHAEVLASVMASANDVESGHGNSDSELGFTTASASYSNPNGGSASAYATLAHALGGSLSVKAFATADGGSGDTGQYISNRSSASADWQDQLHFSNFAENVFVEFVFSFTGSTSGDALGSASFAATDQNGTFLSGGSQSVTGTLTFGYENPTSGTVFIDISLNVAASGYGSGVGGPGSSTASFEHSFDLIAITPRDATGNFLPDVTITSDAGFDYNPLIKVVPEPSTLALLTLGGVITIAARRR